MVDGRRGSRRQRKYSKRIYHPSQTEKDLMVSASQLNPKLCCARRVEEFNLHFFREFSMNISYAPYLPADEEGSATIDNYIRMLDKKYSLEPLIRALEISERNSMSYEELPSGIVRQISVRVPF